MTIADHTTGEVIETTALAIADTSSGVAITGYLQQARDWLATAVEETGPEQIAMAKAEIATAAEATKQLGLSKEIQLDAQEMVRRAEYALGKAIRKGQEEGSVLTTEESRRRSGLLAAVARGEMEQNGITDLLSKPTPSDIEPEFYGNRARGQSMADLVDGVEDPEFDAALGEARSEGNLSRANVARKIKAKSSQSRQSRDVKAELLAELAQQGYSSDQMIPKLGFSRRDQVRALAREHGIEIPADKARGTTRRLNSNRILSGTAESLEVAVLGLQQIDPQELDPESAQEWIDSLTESLTALRKALNSIKESLHG